MLNTRKQPYFAPENTPKKIAREQSKRYYELSGLKTHTSAPCPHCGRKSCRTREICKVKRSKAIAARVKVDVGMFLLLLLLAIPIATAGGFTLKSISSTHIISNNESLSKANITADLTANGGGQSLSGTIDDFSQLGDNLKVQSPIKISMGNIQERLNYQILNQGALYKFTSYYLDAPGLFTGTECPQAPSLCFKIDTDRIGFGYDRLLIVDRIWAASFGYFGNPDISWKGEMTMSINGMQYTEAIGSGEDARGNLQFHDSKGNWMANVMWIGSLVSGQAVPNQDNYVASKTSGSQWQVSGKAYYEKYIKSLSESDTLLQIKADEPSVSENPSCKDEFCSDVLNILTIHNSIIDELLSQNTRIDYSSVTSDSEQVISGGSMVSVLDRTIAFPELIITMHASDLGITILTGIPQIESIDIHNSASGDNTALVIGHIKNTGDFQGTFIGNIPGSHESNKLTLAPNEVGDIVLFLNDTVAGTRAEMLTVYDINSGASDSKEFEISITEAKKFIPNSTLVFDDVVQTATSDGMSSANVLDCSGGIFTMTSNGYDCIPLKDAKVEQPKQQVISAAPISISNPDNAPKGNTLLYLWILVIIFGIIFMCLLIYKIFTIGSRTQKKSIRAAFWGIAVVVILVMSLLYIVPLIPAIENRINEMIFLNNIYEKVKL